MGPMGRIGPIPAWAVLTRRFCLPFGEVVRVQTLIQSGDAALFKLINQGLANPILDHMMVVATYLGLGITQAGFCLAFLMLGFAMDRLDFRRAGYAGMVALTFSLVASQAGKFIWDRPRPLLSMFDVRIVDNALFTHSFPSGHATTAFAVAVAFSMFLPKLRYAAIGLAFLTAVSRVYLGVHYPLDVTYGAILGALVGYASARLVQGWNKQASGVETHGHTNLDTHSSASG